MPNIHKFSENLKVSMSFDAVLANSTQNGAYIDCLGFEKAAVIVNAWTGSGTTFNYTLEESDTGSGSGTTVTGATLGSAISASTADAGSIICNVDLRKRKRYLRVNAVGTGTAGNASALIALFNSRNTAVTQDSGATVQSV